MERGRDAQRVEAQQRRQDRLEKRFGGRLDLHTLPDSVQEVVLGDYLTTSRVTPKKLLRDTVADIETYIRFCSHEHGDPGNVLLFEVFRQNEADFSEVYDRLLVTGSKRDRVFDQEWSRVMGFLRPHEVSNLRRASPAFAVARSSRFFALKKALDEVIEERPEWSDALVDAYHGGMCGATTTEHGWKLRQKMLTVFKRRFQEVDIDPREPFRQALENYIQVPVREAALVNELAKFGLRLRSDSRFCRQYVDGETKACLEEVVATMRVTSYLFGRGHRWWSENHHYLESRMRKGMASGMYKDWYQACEAVMRLPLIEPDDYYEDFGDY